MADATSLPLPAAPESSSHRTLLLMLALAAGVTLFLSKGRRIA